MKKAIIQIDRALKALYQIDHEYKAEEFLVENELPMRGALLIQEPDDEETLNVGIFFQTDIKQKLRSFDQWKGCVWSTKNLQAFSVAAEEISHFHTLLFHAQQNRGVSQLLLELQGEVDKFILSYYAQRGDELSDEALFEQLVERLFERFSLPKNFSDQKKNRYLEANDFAKRFVLKNSALFLEPKQNQKFLAILREFYRLSMSERVSYLGG